MVKFDEEGIKKVLMEKALDKVGMFLVNKAMEKCPVDNGQLRASIGYKIVGDTLYIGTNMESGEYVEFGTGVYHISEEGHPEPRSDWFVFPKNARALRFEVGRKGRLAARKPKTQANIVFAKKVHQFGQSPQPFLRPSVFENISEINKIIRDAFK